MKCSCWKLSEDKAHLHGKCPTADRGHPKSLTDAQRVITVLQKRICRAASLHFCRIERDILPPVVDVNLVTFGSNFLFV